MPFLVQSEQISDLLSKSRREQELAIEEVAKAIGYPADMVSRFERMEGPTCRPSFSGSTPGLSV